MDTPQENPDGFDNTNLTKMVDKLKGNLLLIHGMQDPVVLQQHSVLFVKAAVDKGVQVDYMIYPGHEHNVLGEQGTSLPESNRLFNATSSIVYGRSRIGYRKRNSKNSCRYLFLWICSQ